MSTPHCAVMRFADIRTRWMDGAGTQEIIEAMLDALCAQEAMREAMPVQEPDNRICTCHPDDNPPVPCARKYSLTECRESVREPGPTLAEMANACNVSAAGLMEPNRHLLYAAGKLLQRLALEADDD